MKEQEIQLRCRGKLGNLPLVTALAREICTRILNKKVNKSYCRDVDLCVSEAFTNAVKYGRSSPAAPEVHLSFLLFKDRMTIKVGDEGPGFSLEEVPLPNLNVASERGYGLFLIRKKMDEVGYHRGPERNCLVMTKFYSDTGD